MRQKRRTLLAFGAAAGAGMLPRPASAQPLFSLNDFLALSAQLMQRPTGDLDPDTGRRMLEIYAERGLVPQLSRLAHDAGAQDSELARELVTAWYTGICATPAGPVVISQPKALLWASTSFLHPWGSCGGPTGYWSEPPSHGPTLT